jgi:hypothetical protein
MRLISNRHTRGSALVWLLFLILAGAAIFLFFQKPSTLSEKPTTVLSPTTSAPSEPTETLGEPVATPAMSGDEPLATVVANPTPEDTAAPVSPTVEADLTVAEVPVAEAIPQPTIPATTPRPPQIPLKLADVVQDHSLWPPQIALTKPTQFPAVMNGQVIGSVGQPVGTVFRLVGVSLLGAEVVFRGATTRIPASATDLLARAEALRPQSADIPAAAAVLASSKIVTPTPVPKKESAAPVVYLAPSKLEIEMVRLKQSRIEGGDWDDKVDHITLKAKLQNPDTKLSAEKLHGTIYLFADSILTRGNRLLLGRYSFDCELGPRAERSFTTAEFSCAYDTTDARFGYKYAGWVLQLQDAKGKTQFVKASAPSLEKASEHFAKLKDKAVYDRDFKLKSETAGRGID